VVDAAEQQETVEVLLAYRFLAGAAEPLTAAELDTAVQAWLRESYRAEIDFQVGDALAKLRDLDLVVPVGGAGDADGQAGERLEGRPLPAAIEVLDRRWDQMFGRTAARLRES
jgi:hypothetical protein